MDEIFVLYGSGPFTWACFVVRLNRTLQLLLILDMFIVVKSQTEHDLVFDAVYLKDIFCVYIAVFQWQICTLVQNGNKYLNPLMIFE